MDMEFVPSGRFDPDFGVREATLIFQASHMYVIDEIKSRIKSNTLSFVDFLEGEGEYVSALPSPASCCTVADLALLQTAYLLIVQS